MIRFHCDSHDALSLMLFRDPGPLTICGYRPAPSDELAHVRPRKKMFTAQADRLAPKIKDLFCLSSRAPTY
jgi:hypothetical protein